MTNDCLLYTSRLTLTTVGHDEVIEQITKNLNKLIEVVKLVDLSESAHIERELMLVKVKATGAQRAEVKRTTDIFRGQIVYCLLYTSSPVTQATSSSGKLSLMPIAAGKPKPMVPRPPELIQRLGLLNL